MNTFPHDEGHAHRVGLDETLDFINTYELVSGAPVDHYETLADAVDWLAAHGVLHPESAAAERGRAAADPAAATERLGRVRALRAALREVADAVYERRAPSGEAIDEINRVLRAREVIQLEPAADGVSVGHRHEGDPIEDALARLVEPVADEIAAGRPDRVRVCANDRCRWLFYDSSRTGRRRWCNMAVCGNRAKVARHRARRRQGETVEG